MPRNNGSGNVDVDGDDALGAGDNGEGSSSVASSAETHQTYVRQFREEMYRAIFWPQTNPAAAPASNPHSAVQPHNVMPATQPGAAPRSSRVDPFDDTRSRGLGNRPAASSTQAQGSGSESQSNSQINTSAPQEEQGGNTADADAAGSSSNASDSDDDMADARSDASDPAEAAWADLLYRGVSTREALRLAYPEDYAKLVAEEAEEEAAAAAANGYTAQSHPTYEYPGLPQTDVGSTFAPDHQPPNVPPNQPPVVFPNAANNVGTLPDSGPDMAANRADPEVQREPAASHETGADDWPWWLDLRFFEDGSMSGAANTDPQPCFPVGAPAQHQPQPFEGSEVDAPHEMDYDYDYSGDGTAAVDGASTGATGTPASGAYTTGTDYSDANFGFK